MGLEVTKAVFSSGEAKETENLTRMVAGESVKTPLTLF